jgi:outer membrane protein TolC
VRLFTGGNGVKKRCSHYLAVLSVVVLFVASVNPIAWAAETSTPMSLQEIVSTAVRDNPAVIEQQKLWEEKIGRIPVASAWANPKIGIMKDDIPHSSLNPVNGMMTQFSLNQEIMNPVKLKLMGKMAQNDAAMSQSSYNNKQVEVYTDTKAAYYDLLYATKALEIGRENQQLMGQLVQIAQVNYSTGLVPLQDTLRAQTEFSKMTTDLLGMAAMEAIAKAKINTFMARSADAPLVVKEEFKAPPPNFDLDYLRKAALENKPAIIGMKKQLEMATSGIELAKKQKLPDYELQLAYKDYKQPEMEPSGTNTWQIGIMAMIPIWKDKNEGQIKAATASHDAAQAALASMQNMATLDVQMALTEAQTAWRQIDLYQNTIVPQAEQSYQAAVVAYTNGKADFMTVLDSVSTLRNAKLDAYKSRITYEKAAASLEKAVGKPLFGSFDPVSK